MVGTPLNRVLEFFTGFQLALCGQVESLDSSGVFQEDAWDRQEGGGGKTRILRGGSVFEKAGINFSHVSGARLPASATAHRPQLGGAPFDATGVSLVFHPFNPYIPTTHLNVRYFEARPNGGEPEWWFGGGFDLTPYYFFREDAVAWHRAAREATGAYYPQFKNGCDDYFYLNHRNETRGIGGLFYDDFNEPDFDSCFTLTRSVAEAFFPTYAAIVERRRKTEFGQRELNWQRHRRGRYVEFNLVYDRGTLFGLQSGGRTESILMSLPPHACWSYQYQPEPDSPEAALLKVLRPIDWLGNSSPAKPPA